MPLRRSIFPSQASFVDENQVLAGILGGKEALDNKVKLKLYRRQTRRESILQQDRFLSFKDQMKFKTVDDISQHYRMIELVGSGAFGKVYSGASTRVGMPCAIKEISKV